MIPWSNSIPLVFLGLICCGFIVVASWKVYSKRRRASRRNDVEVDQPTEEDVDYNEVLVIGRTTTKKKTRAPKMWDVKVPPNVKASFDDNDYDEDDIKKVFGQWRSITPMSVSYIKHLDDPPSYLSTTHHTQAPDIQIPSHEASLNNSQHPLAGDHDPRRGNVVYNKKAIQAVQVSVLISLPRAPDDQGEAAGPLALGVAEVGVKEMNRWRKRPHTYATAI